MTRLSLATLALTGALAVSGPAAAQDVVSPRPFDGIFGGAGTSQRKSALDASVSLAGGYEDNGQLADSGSTSPFDQTGAYSMLTGSLAYTHSGQDVQFSASGGSSGRYQTSPGGFYRVSDFAAVGISAKLNRRWDLFANQSTTCGPLRFSGLLPASGAPVPGVPVGAGVDYSLSTERACNYTELGSVTYGLTPRAAVDLTLNRSDTFFGQASGFDPVGSWSAGGHFFYNLSQHARVHMGYTQRQNSYGLNGPSYTRTVHDIDAGIDYQKPLSLTRRTYLDFTTGSTIVTLPETAANASTLQFRFVGSAALNQEFGRTWRARVGYNRGVGFVDGLNDPVYSDAVDASLNGYFNRRTDFSAYLTTSFGNIASTDASSPYHAYTASMRVRYALARAWALFGEYTYYSYDFGTASLAYPVAPALDRQAARVGLTWWIPLLGR